MLTDDDVTFRAVRASGPGGQHVNATSSAVELRFDLAGSELSEGVKDRLGRLAGTKLNSEGVIVIFAQEHRSQFMNKAAALARLNEMVERAKHVPKKRRPTKPTKASKERRLDAKRTRAGVKAGRGKPPPE